LQSLDISGKQYGVLLTPIILSRLPSDIRMEWARTAVNEGDQTFIMDVYYDSVSYSTHRRRLHATVDKALARPMASTDASLDDLEFENQDINDIDSVPDDVSDLDLGPQEASSLENESDVGSSISLHASLSEGVPSDYDLDHDDLYPEWLDDFEIDDFAPVETETSESEGEEEVQEEVIPLADRLSEWASSLKVNHAQISGLLDILHHDHPDLPKDPRTLLRTNVSFDVLDVADGQYYHFGIKNNVITQLELDPENLENLQEISLLINIDGLPIFKSSPGQLWPILGMIDCMSVKEPFVIGLFYGLTKPKDLTEYLSYFVQEVRDLSEIGITCLGVNFGIRIHGFVCDAPARAFVKGTKSHSGYSACERCTTHGVWLNKVTFPELNAPLRTDETFQAMTDEDHHVGPSPLTDLTLGMVTQFPLDYMHLVCLGVMRRLILLWKKGPLGTRVGANKIEIISDFLVSLRGHVPREFARKPRSLQELDRWKATEFRQFLLYTWSSCVIQD
jgi:hypothetical protein